MINIGPKSTNFKTVEFPRAINDLTALFEFLGNKQEYEAHLKRLTELRDEANEAISHVGKASKIESLLIEAEQINEKAKNEQGHAQIKANNILLDAESKASLVLANAQTRANDLISEAEALKANAEQDRNKALADKIAYEKGAQEVSDRIKVIDKREKELAEIQKEIDHKKALLAQL